MKGTLFQLGDNKWKIGVDCGKNAEGKRDRRWFIFYGTKREAEKELAKKVATADSGLVASDEKITVGQYLDQWFATCVEPSLRPATVAMYESRIRLHIKPAIGDVKLARLTGKDLQKFYAKLIRKPGDEKGLAPQTVRIIHVILHAAFKQAVIWENLPKNPADAATVKKVKPAKKVVMDADRTIELLDALADTKLRAAAMVLAYTGIRRGELLALRWASVDLSDAAMGAVLVVDNIERIKGKTIVVGPKTEKGERTIPIPAALVKELKKHKAEQNERRFRFGSSWKNLDLVFDGGDGDYWAPTTFSDMFSRYAKRYGFDGMVPHGMRHGHASILQKNGASLKTIQERLGHSSIEITDGYLHSLGGEQEEASQLMEDLLQPKKKKGTR